MKSQSRINHPIALAAGTLLAGGVLVACGGGGSSDTNLELPAAVSADQFTGMPRASCNPPWVHGSKPILRQVLN